MFLRSIKPKEYNEVQNVERMREETLSDLAIPGIVLKSFYEIIIIFIATIIPIFIIILIIYFSQKGMCDDSPPCVDFLLLYLWPLISLAALVFHILCSRLCMLCFFRFWNSILSHTPFFLQGFVCLFTSKTGRATLPAITCFSSITSEGILTLKVFFSTTGKTCLLLRNRSS